MLALRTFTLKNPALNTGEISADMLTDLGVEYPAEYADRRAGLVRAGALVKRHADPWVLDIITQVTRTRSRRSVRLVKGSRIIVDKF